MSAPLGRRGAPAPSTPPVAIDRARVEGLIRLSLAGLEAMYDPAREALFSVTYEDGRRQSVDHLGIRYTVMSCLGIHEAKVAGFATTLDAGTLLKSGLARHPTPNIDHLAMALWADVTVDAGVGASVLPKLLKSLEKDLDGVVGRELAWALTGLALHSTRDSDVKVRAAAKRLRDLAIEVCWKEGGGLFDHFVGGNRWLRPQALFSTQIYWVYALATYGRIFNDSEAIRIATRCADTLIALRDPFHGWCWRYHAPSGRVTERYPVYSVHQDAMAPMALNVLGDANGRDYREINRESLGWLWRNELGENMVDEQEQVIWRAIRRVYPLNRAAYGLGWATSWAGLDSPVADRPWALRVNRTCRPYHLGWLLHAWTRTVRVPPGGDRLGGL